MDALALAQAQAQLWMYDPSLYYHPAPPYSIFPLEHNTQWMYDTYSVSVFEYRIHTLVTGRDYMVKYWIDWIKWFLSWHGVDGCVVALTVRRASISTDENPKVATIQLCAASSCLIFQVHQAKQIPIPLVNFMKDPAYTFVGHGIMETVQILKEAFNFDGEVNLNDLASLAAGVGIMGAGLPELARRIMRFPHYGEAGRVTSSNGENDLLTMDQIFYATTEALVTYEVGKLLKIQFGNPLLRN